MVKGKHEATIKGNKLSLKNMWIGLLRRSLFPFMLYFQDLSAFYFASSFSTADYCKFLYNGSEASFQSAGDG